MLRVMFWNCNGISKKRHHFEDMLDRHSPDIFALTESKLIPTITDKEVVTGWQKLVSASLSSFAISHGAERESVQHTPTLNQIRLIHQTSNRSINYTPPTSWLKFNEVVFAPTKEGEEERPAEVYHQRAHIKYQYDKMMFLCRMIRGMSVDEAKKQLTFKNKAGATLLKEIIEEAQDIAVDKHNVEYKHNMWIAEAFPANAGFMKNYRKHAKSSMGVVHYRFIHVFLKLSEGEPPEFYYPPKIRGSGHIERYISDQRKRRIRGTL